MCSVVADRLYRHLGKTNNIKEKLENIKIRLVCFTAQASNLRLLKYCESRGDVPILNMRGLRNEFKFSSVCWYVRECIMERIIVNFAPSAI